MKITSWENWRNIAEALGNTASAASEKGYSNAKCLLFAPLRYPNNCAAQVLEAPNGVRKFLEELVGYLNGNYGCIDHAIVGAQAPEGHGEGKSRVQTPTFRWADFLLIPDMGEVCIPGKWYLLYLQIKMEGGQFEDLLTCQPQFSCWENEETNLLGSHFWKHEWEQGKILDQF